MRYCSCYRGQPPQNTINVPGDQATIQDAINAANNGDTVLVAPGSIYENVNFSGKAITVTSSGAAVTIIDGGHKTSVITFSSGENPNSVLNGFTIQNGTAGFDGGGVSISSASPTITNNIVQNNTAGTSGGGISLSFASPLIQGNTIRSNTQITGYSGGGGGGIAIVGASSAQIIR